MWKAAFAILITAAFVPACGCDTRPDKSEVKGTTMSGKITKTDEEWRRELTPEQYHILREKGTERPFSGEYNDYKGEDVFRCAACGNVLFTGADKFDSHCGWPSFNSPASKDGVETETDTSHGAVRTEVLCSRCGGHLGHVFEDGPPPTGLRYCINSAALKLDREKAGEK